MFLDVYKVLIQNTTMKKKKKENCDMNILLINVVINMSSTMHVGNM